MKREGHESFIWEGRVVALSGEKNAEELPWSNHPTFPGVSLKHLLTAEDTEGKFSCHLVRVLKGHEIGRHIHAGKWELHEVVSGAGRCVVEDRMVEYRPGVIMAIPADSPHVVSAQEGDLFLRAKFIPALL